MLPRYYRYLNISNDPFNRQELLDSVTTKKIYTIAMWKKWGYKDKLFKEEFQIEITEQSKKRRLNYINNFQREKLFEEKDYKFEDYHLS